MAKNTATVTVIVVGAVLAALFLFQDKIKGFFSGVSDVAQGTGDVFTGVGTGVTGLGQGVSDISTGTAAATNQVLDSTANAVSSLLSPATQLFDFFGQQVNRGAQTFNRITSPSSKTRTRSITSSSNIPIRVPSTRSRSARAVVSRTFPVQFGTIHSSAQAVPTVFGAKSLTSTRTVDQQRAMTAKKAVSSRPRTSRSIVRNAMSSRSSTDAKRSVITPQRRSSLIRRVGSSSFQALARRAGLV